MKWLLLMANIIQLPSGMTAVNPPPEGFASRVFDSELECNEAGLEYIREHMPEKGILHHYCKPDK